MWSISEVEILQKNESRSTTLAASTTPNIFSWVHVFSANPGNILIMEKLKKFKFILTLNLSFMIIVLMENKQSHIRNLSEKDGYNFLRRKYFMRKKSHKRDLVGPLRPVL